MDKRKKILIIGIGIALLSLLGVLYFTNKNNSTKNTNSSFGTMQNNNGPSYYVESGIEDPAALAQKAVEEYLKQDLGESKNDRSNRLKKYFLDTSSIFSESNTANMTGRVTSVTSCEEQEGGDWCLLVMADIKIDDQPTVNKTYWITVQKKQDGSFIANDMGLW